jgi:hypothetical protein
MDRPICRITSSDYLDKDVYLNIRAFYRAAGYRLIPPTARLNSASDDQADLLVVLRGDNGSDLKDFHGPIHIYDYVKEYAIDWERRYPSASHVTVVALASSSFHPAEDSHSASDDSSRVSRVDAYLPVIPALWMRSWSGKRQQPVHISNFKRMGDDAYQRDLLALIRAGVVRAFGANWQLAGVRARPLSYRQANQLLAASACCFGLMWPYQRGRTLSGRMWQAPLNGCFVLSETGTDILGCPGVIECEAFHAGAAALELSPQACRDLADEASAFWESHSRSLAKALGFDPGLSLTPADLRPERALLLLWDLQFRWQRLVVSFQAALMPPFHRLRRAVAQLARRCGLHPRERSARRTRS